MGKCQEYVHEALKGTKNNYGVINSILDCLKYLAIQIDEIQGVNKKKKAVLTLKDKNVFLDKNKAIAKHIFTKRHSKKDSADFVELARKQLGYSINTVDYDILHSLKKIWKG